MNIRIFDSYEEASLAAAQAVAAAIRSEDRPVLGLATGETPLALYRDLVRLNDAGALDLSGVHTYNLDEYVGLDGTHPQSYRYFMDKNLFEPIGLSHAVTHVPSGTAEDLHAAAAFYDATIEAEGGITIQVLGIGRNGHIGFNEPDTVFHYGTHVVDLTDSTIDANSRFFESRDEVPTQAVTMGVGPIMAAKKVIMLCFGANKAEAVRAMVRGAIDPQCPASILQLHANTEIYLDKTAASLL